MNVQEPLKTSVKSVIDLAGLCNLKFGSQHSTQSLQLKDSIILNLKPTFPLKHPYNTLWFKLGFIVVP